MLGKYRMKTLFIIPLVLISMISSPSKSEEYRFWGHGASSCGELLTEIQDNDGSLNFINQISLSSWIQGYLSGMNFISDRRISSNNDIDGIVFELIKRCKEEPMSTISDELNWIYKNKIK
jgi:hypothetical protein